MQAIRTVVVLLAIVSTPAHAQSWLAMCDAVRQFTSVMQVGADVVISNRPTLASNPPYWALSYEGITLPLPDIPFSSVAISTQANGEVLLVLASVQDDVTFSIGLATLPIRRGAELIPGMENVPASSSDFIDLALQVTTDDLTCGEAPFMHEATGLVAMSIKNLLSYGELVEAYRGVGDHEGWLTLGVLPQHNSWEALSPYRLSDEMFVKVAYQVPPGSPWSEIGLQVGLPITEEVDPPRWAVPLADALVTRDKVALQELAARLGWDFQDLDMVDTSAVQDTGQLYGPR